jgi:hypothetical protein
MEMKPKKTPNTLASRREFLKQTAIATTAVAAASLLPPTVYGQAPSAGKVLGANDRIVIGYIGVGNQGLNPRLFDERRANNITRRRVRRVDQTRRRGEGAHRERQRQCQG